METFHGQGGGAVYLNDPWNRDLSRGFIIDSQDELLDLFKSFPRWPGENKPQDLERAKIDFSKYILVMVSRQDMYGWPEITEIFQTGDTIEVRYKLPPLESGDIRPRAMGVCTYAAAKIKKTPSTFVFTRTDTTARASTDDEFVRAGQEVKLRQLNQHLPNITFKKWIDGLAMLGSPAEWEANDCGEATGSPSDTLRDLPVCAQAKIALRDGGTFYMLVAVGTNDKGVHGRPGLYWAAIERADSVRYFRSDYETWSYFERQKSLAPGADPMPERVRLAVLHAWEGYKQYAWGHDDLNPLSRTPRDWYGGPCS